MTFWPQKKHEACNLARESGLLNFGGKSLKARLK